MIKKVSVIDPSGLVGVHKQATIRTIDSHKAVFVASEDYYESGGIPYSGMYFDRNELEQLLAMLDS